MNFMIKLLKNKKYPILKGFVRGLVFMSILSFFLFSSCRKSPETLGKSILPENAQLKVFYGFWDGMYGYSVLEDSIRTDELSKNLLGSTYDSVFGITTANVATQFTLTNSGVDFGENPQLDSLVLYLRYNGELYGDGLSTQKLHVYELNQDIYIDSTYNSKSVFSFDPFDYADLTYIPAPYDSVVMGDGTLADTLPPQMMINLSNISPDLGQKLLNADSATLSGDSTFRDYFKGLYFKSDPVMSNGALFSVNFLLSGSQMVLYYHNDEDDSLQFSFRVYNSLARANTYEHDYTNSPQEFRSQVIDGDTALGTEKLYVHGVGGVKTILKIPDISNYFNSEKVALNEVKLILPGYGNTSSNAPERLALVKIIDDGSYLPIIDQYEGNDYFGGTYKSGSNEYVFRITRYMQSILSGTEINNGLYLFVSGQSVNPENFIIKGNQFQSDTTGMRLEIIYTDLDNKN